MKKLYALILAAALVNPATAQWMAETVGAPAQPTSVNTYTGWSNQGLVDYNGTAMVDTANASNNTYSSGGGNVVFANTPGTLFQLSGFPDVTDAAWINIQFNMHGYDTANPTVLNDLELYVSTDSGTNWTLTPYARSYSLFPAITPMPWDYFSAGMEMPYTITSSPWGNEYIYSDFSKVFVRFVQTSSTKIFRIDDILVYPGVPLDIQLISFSAAPRNGKNVVSWTAASKSEHEVFYLEKSADGKTFTAINEQQARGNGQFDYSYEDGTENLPNSYYRLKFTDESGKVSYSKILRISVGSNENTLLKNVYPNPVQQVLFAEINSNATQSISIILTDITGKQVEKMSLPPTQTGIYQIPVAHLADGIYHLHINDGMKKEVRKIVVQK